MNRRRFLRVSLVLGGLAGAGTLCFVRHGQARAALRAKLLAEALPLLTSSSAQELQTLPSRAREGIKRYFHGKCLNVEGFVSHVCSTAFRERLGRCQTSKEREECFFQAFCGRVATEAEILNQVETTAAELGSELDTTWDRFCAGLAGKWNAHVTSYGSSLAAEDLIARTNDTIRSELGQTVRQATSGDQAPALGQAVEEIGRSAVLLLPLVRLGKAGLAVGLPVFVVLAAKPVWDYITALLEDRRKDRQAEISGRLALLGNHVGAEFESEVRRRLADLHAWRELSVREAARRLAEERINLFGRMR